MSDQDAIPDEIVERYWPYDGPHSEKKLELAAKVIDGLVRYMNNALWSVSPNGPSTYRVLSGLNSAVYGLDQLFEQLGRSVGRLIEDPTMYDDRRDRPAPQTALELEASVLQAKRHLEPLRGEMDYAARTASHLGHESRRQRRRGGA